MALNNYLMTYCFKNHFYNTLPKILLKYFFSLYSLYISKHQMNLFKSVSNEKAINKNVT